MLFSTVIVFLFLQTNNLLRAQDLNCYPPSMVDFVRDSLPNICFGSDSAGFLNYSMNNVEFYNAHCRVYNDIKNCLETKLNHCSEDVPGFKKHILNLIESYQLPFEFFDYDAKVYDENHYFQNLIPFCDGDKLSSHFLHQFDRSLLNCVTNVTLAKHKDCLATFKQNIQIILQTRASLNEITKWSEDFLRCIYNAIPMSCTRATKEVFVFKELLAVPEKQDSSKPTALNITKIVKQKLPSQQVEQFSQSKRVTSSIHGDPHIVQLHATKAVTCRLLNNRTYISNPHFKITGISKYIGDPVLTATAITSLQVDFFGPNGSLIAYYRASNGKLPLEVNYLDSLSKSIIKIDHSAAHATEGHINFIHLPTSTQIVVNSWTKFHYFLIRSSELLLNNSDGYLITGCPQNEIIDRQAIVARLRERFMQSQRQVSVRTARQHRHIVLDESKLPDECEKICSSDENDFIDECIFDCLALASVNVTQALQVNRMHMKTSRERRQLIENDQHVVNDFKECYKKGLVCKKMKDSDYADDHALIQQNSSLIITLMLWFLVVLN